MTSEVSQETIDFYQQILKNNSVEGTIEDIQIRVPAELHGEHFASVVEYISLKLDNGELLSLFSKRITSNPEYSARIKLLNAFPKEAGMFNTVIKDIQEFYAKRSKSGKKELDFLPKCYFADESRVVMDNLVTKGYGLISKLEKMDLETTKLVLRNLAQFHAVSYAMREEVGEEALVSKYPCLEESLYKAKESESDTFAKSFFKSTLENCVIILNKAGEIEGKALALDVLSRYDYSTLFEEICSTIDRQTESHIFSVINHGDAWSNNMLFHRNPETGQTDHLVLCDFQISRYGSPNIDLAYFLYTSVKPEIRRQNFEGLMKYYFECLKEFVEDLDVFFDVNYQEFLKDYKRKSPNGFWVNLFFLLIAHEVLGSFDVEETMEGDFDDMIRKKVETFMTKNPDRAQFFAEESAALFQEQFGT